MNSLQKPIIIYDTDMDTDCDDAGALAMLLNAARAGQIRLAGIIADAPGAFVAPCCEAFCHYYGVPTPVGSISAKQYAGAPRFADYRVHVANTRIGRLYNRVLAPRVGKTDEDYPAAARLYRQLLADAPDGGVTIVCVGFLTALAELLQTGADDVSPLSGVELVRRKVQRVVSMGDAPWGCERKINFNYRMDGVGAEIFFQLCPVPVFVCPEGTEVITGSSLTGKLPADHPLRIAYECWGGPNTGRSSWDLLTVLHALDPDTPCLNAEHHGTIHFSSDPQKLWWAEDGSRQDALLTAAMPYQEIADLLENMLY